MIELALVDSIINDEDIYIYPELGDINPMNFDEVKRCGEEEEGNSRGD